MATESKIRLGGHRDMPPLLRTGSVYVRALHLIAGSVVLGAYVLDAVDRSVLTWLLICATSGFVMLAYEIKSHPDFFKQISGWASLGKLVVFGLVPVWPSGAVLLLIVGYVIAVLGAHLPKRWRHRMLI